MHACPIIEGALPEPGGMGPPMNCWYFMLLRPSPSTGHVVTFCSPIHSGERQVQNTLRYSILHLDAYFSGANTFTDVIRSIFEPQNHCKVNWQISHDFSALYYRYIQWSAC